MKNRINAALVASLVIVSTASHAEFSANAALTSDYIWRGISQSANDPAIQLGLDYSHESGLYAGVWGSNVDWWETGDAGVDNGEDIEVDIYGGYSSKFDFGMAYDVGFIHYAYYDTNTTDPDFTELYAGMNFNVAVVNVSMKLSYADNFANSGDRAWYLEAGLSAALPKDYTLTLRGGRSDGEYYFNNNLEYFDISLGVSKEIAGFGLDLTYYDTDYDGAKKDRVGALQNDGQLVFTVSRAFDL